MRIIDLPEENQEAIAQVAQLLVDGFAENWPYAWPELDEALQEVREAFSEDRISRIAVAHDGTILGWIGAISTYDGNVWELHPMVVRRDRQGQGIGRALVEDLEEQVRQRGGLTIWLGTDDESGMTSLGGVDLYPNPLDHLAKIRNLRNHPFGFYQKLGFAIAGILPDANGFGKPDIFMAKRVRSRS